MFHILIRLALLLAMLNNEGMGGLEIHDDSPEIDPVSPVVLGSFLKYGLTEISTLSLTLTPTPILTLTLTLAMLNNEGMGGLEIYHDSLKNNPVSLWNWVHSSNVG